VSSSHVVYRKDLRSLISGNAVPSAMSAIGYTPPFEANEEAAAM
jgi:hypothetical protein